MARWRMTLISTSLLDGDLIGEEGQRLPFEALLASEGGTLARSVLEGGRPWPAAKAHQRSPRNAAAAARNKRSLHTMLPALSRRLGIDREREYALRTRLRRSAATTRCLCRAS